MTAEKIQLIIEEELKSVPDRSNVFGLNLEKCLISPIQESYQDANNPTEVYQLWTVLEESKDKKGYKIYYDAETGMFGLATASEIGGLMDIGNYGTFLKTLYSM